MTHVNCPKCGRRLKLPPIHETRGVRCSACKHEFTVKPPAQPPPLPTNDTGNTYTARQSQDLAPQQPRSADRVYGGIRRLPYFGLMMGLAIMCFGLEAGVTSPGGALPITLASTAAVLFLMYHRLKNIGMNPWWCLWALIPFLGWLAGIPCLVYQEGYRDTGKLDAAAMVIVYILLGLFLAVVLGAVIIWAVA